MAPYAKANRGNGGRADHGVPAVFASLRRLTGRSGWTRMLIARVTARSPLAARVSAAAGVLDDLGAAF